MLCSDKDIMLLPTCCNNRKLVSRHIIRDMRHVDRNIMSLLRITWLFRDNIMFGVVHVNRNIMSMSRHNHDKKYMQRKVFHYFCGQICPLLSVMARESHKVVKHENMFQK